MSCDLRVRPTGWLPMRQKSVLTPGVLNPGSSASIFATPPLWGWKWWLQWLGKRLKRNLFSDCPVWLWVVLAALHAVHGRFVLPEMSFYKLILNISKTIRWIEFYTFKNFRDSALTHGLSSLLIIPDSKAFETLEYVLGHQFNNLGFKWLRWSKNSVDRFKFTCLVAWPSNENEAGWKLFLCKFIINGTRTESIT